MIPVPFILFGIAYLQRQQMTIPLVESLAKCMLVNCFPLVAAKIKIKMEQIMQPMIRLLFSAAICTIGLMRIIHQELKP